jgi:hypothetical protein
MILITMNGYFRNYEYIYIYTLWLFNIAMENGPFIDDFPIKTSIYKGFSMAMSNNQMVYIFSRDIFLTHRIHGAAIYGNIYHQYTPVMLAYIPAPWILWVINPLNQTPWHPTRPAPSNWQLYKLPEPA